MGLAERMRERQGADAYPETEDDAPATAAVAVTEEPGEAPREVPADVVASIVATFAGESAGGKARYEHKTGDVKAFVYLPARVGDTVTITIS